MRSEKVRTRFAPSPTGYMHVGNLRTALYAWLIARKNNGTFILRIEDTDQERKVEGAVDIIYRTLAETGLNHDEGPDIGGDYGPYVQSERKEAGIYTKCALDLIEKGTAYRCFCTKERLDALRAECESAGRQTKYDGRCSHLSKEEINENLKNGTPFVVRQKMPSTGSTSFHDEVYGDISVENSTLEDLVLMKSDGFPTYNFANVVDDHLMGITHIVRGSEYLISTPKYNLLYEAFGWEKPAYVHVSPVMRDATRKLSKRDGDASYADFIEKGCLKEALLNYVALLGWNPGTEQEKFTIPELIQAFSISGISKSPAIFDEMKLRWLNSEYIRAMSHDEFKSAAMPFIKKAVKREDVNFDVILEGLHKRTEFFSDIPPQIDFIDQMPDYSADLYINNKMKTDRSNSLQALEILQPVLESFTDWDHEKLYEKIVNVATEKNINKKVLLWSLRVALSGKELTPGGGTDIAVVIGKKETVKRLCSGIEKLRK
ncbi:MAG TPA: glutamate--tRNA ligase [bacterium]|nr:glutamate--tRNA ligase [bacterium]HPS29029.1 glutamate--tRNA ligase [bacterium]